MLSGMWFVVCDEVRGRKEFVHVMMSQLPACLQNCLVRRSSKPC